MANVNELTNNIRAWADARNFGNDSSKQLIKLGEEYGELCEAHNKHYPNKIKDSLGDMFVVLTIYAKQQGLKIEDCIQEAYDTIEHRDGKMIDGVFVKQADLQED